MNSKHILLAIAALILVSALYSLQMNRTVPAGTATTTPSAMTFGELASSTTIDLANPGTLPKGVTIEQIAPTQTKIPVPDFKKPLACTVGADVCAALAKKYVETQALLAKNDADFWAWIDMGTLRKSAGDYAGAATIWEFVSKQYPGNPTSFANLGDLYANYLKNPAKAEANYLTSIKNYAENANAYRALFDMYSAQKASAKAIAILEKGIVANPKMIDLRVLLARYYKELGRPADATATYYAAIETAESQDQKDLAASLRAESGL